MTSWTLYISFYVYLFYLHGINRNIDTSQQRSRRYLQRDGENGDRDSDIGGRRMTVKILGLQVLWSLRRLPSTIVQHMQTFSYWSAEKSFLESVLLEPQSRHIMFSYQMSAKMSNLALVSILLTCELDILSGYQNNFVTFIRASVCTNIQK